MGDDFSQVGRAVAQAGGERGEGVHVVAESLGDADASVRGPLEGQLERTKQASRARDGLRDKSKLSEDTLPLLGRDARCSGKRGEDLGKGQFPVGRELQGLAKGVNDPAQDELPSGPAAVALQELLERDGLVAVFLCGGRTSEHFVNSGQEMSPDNVHALVAALTQLDEVIHEHVRVSKGSIEGAV